MKELSIEEKAKAYDEAIKRAREYDFSLTGVCAGDVIEDIFPELKESEDEKIRGKLVEYFLHYPDHEITYYDLKADSVIAWLEKQGEETIPLKEIILNVWELGNYWKELTKGVCNTEYGRQLDYIVKHWKEGEHYIKSFEKKGEQKRTDKVEPKFHEGDWVVQGYNILKIKCVGDTHYCFETVGGYGDDMLVSEIDSQFHLWSIQDAKDGDALYLQKDGKEHIIIYKGVIKERFRTFVSAYCAYNGIVDAFCFADVSRYVDIAYRGIMPATKEQRDLLFQKMKEEGYEWDAEKKELKKIEQKPAWSEEDESIALGIEQLCNCASLLNIAPDKIDKIRTWLKSLKDKVQPQPKQELSDEDKDAIDMAVIALEDWLKNLNDRVQPKQEWSEEDEGCLENAIMYCKWARDIAPDLHCYEISEKSINWLKSLKERYTWKPSDEQMKALWEAYKGGEEQAALASLYSDLNKLREE